MIIQQAKINILNIEQSTLEESSTNLDIGSPLVIPFLENTILKFNKKDPKKGELNNDKFNILDEVGNDFESLTSQISNEMFEIVKNMAVIESGIMLAVIFSDEADRYFAFIKADFLSNLTVQSNGELLREKMLLPESGVIANEGIVINLETQNYKLLEKSYLVDGKRQSYFSNQVFELEPEISEKSVINNVFLSVKHVADKFDIPLHEAVSKMQGVIVDDIENEGYVNIDDLAKKVFRENLTAQEVMKDELEDKHIVDEIKIDDPIDAIKKYSTHKYKLEGGINISIPNEIIEKNELVKFKNNYDDGTLTIEIKVNDIKPQFRA